LFCLYGPRFTCKTKKVKMERQLVNLFWILLRIAESEENSTCKKRKKKENHLGCTYIHTNIHT
jgi:hypothetical protein